MTFSPRTGHFPTIFWHYNVAVGKLKLTWFILLIDSLFLRFNIFTRKDTSPVLSVACIFTETKCHLWIGGFKYLLKKWFLNYILNTFLCLIVFFFSGTKLNSFVFYHFDFLSSPFKVLVWLMFSSLPSVTRILFSLLSFLLLPNVTFIFVMAFFFPSTTAHPILVFLEAIVSLSSL